MKSKVPYLFLIVALIALLAGLTFGVLSGVQYLLPQFLKELLPFSALRPMHVTSVISWILLASTGGVYIYLSQITDGKLKFPRLPIVHFAFFIATGLAIYICYLTRHFGGKEYLEFPPILIAPVLIGWVLFGIFYFKNVIRIQNWPVYLWMWATGIALMIYHLVEAYLWTHPEVGGNFIRSLTIQWKAGGSFVGAWNMLVNGTAIYVMHKIGGKYETGRTREAFFFYFLGLTNLMFGWAHHIYIVPTVPWLRYLSYVISMTEWIIIWKMIYQWRKGIQPDEKIKNLMPYKFLGAADRSIFVNLILALLFSIPAINFFTHGTHFTVAHSMGTTIGINTTILLASLLFIAQKYSTFESKSALKGYKIFNISLAIFWCSLIVAGLRKSIWQASENPAIFSEMNSSLFVVYLVFLLSGIGLLTGLSMIVIPLLRQFVNICFKKNYT